MADSLRASFDSAQWDTIFAKLAGPGRESLARRMGVSGGVILRDEAKERAPMSDGNYNETSGGSQQSGQLKDSIYLAFNTTLSTSTTFVYSVSWNADLAWWGKLIEFGHYIRYPYYRDAEGVYHTNKKRGLLANPFWVPAQPFLQPAFDSSQGRAKVAMLERGRVEVQILFQG